MTPGYPIQDSSSAVIITTSVIIHNCPTYSRERILSVEQDDNPICQKFCLLLFSPVTDTVVVRGVGVVMRQEVGGMVVGGEEMDHTTANNL